MHFRSNSKGEGSVCPAHLVYCFDVVGLCTLEVSKHVGGFHLPWVYLHLSIGNTVLV